MKFKINKRANKKGSHLSIDGSLQHAYPQISHRYACKIIDLMEVYFPEVLSESRELLFINFMRDIESILRISMLEACENE